MPKNASPDNGWIPGVYLLMNKKYPKGEVHMKRVLLALLTLAVATAISGCGSHDLGNAINPTPADIPMNATRAGITLNATVQNTPVPNAYGYVLSGVVSGMPAGTKVVLTTDVANLTFAPAGSNLPAENTITVTPDTVNGVYGATASTMSPPAGNHYLKAKTTFGNYSASYHFTTN